MKFSFEEHTKYGSSETLKSEYTTDGQRDLALLKKYIKVGHNFWLKVKVRNYCYRLLCSSDVFQCIGLGGSAAINFQL